MDNLQIDFLDKKKDNGLTIQFLDSPKQKVASGVWESIQAGYQGSLAGLIDRGKLPDIVLDPHHAKWYEKLAAGASQIVNEGPEMLAGGVVGAFAGGAAGTAVPVIGNIAGGVAGAGAGSFAVPTAIRESLIQAYSKGEVVNTADFLSRAAIVVKQTAKDAAIGAVSSLTGMWASRAVGTAIAPMVGNQITAQTAGRVIGATGTTAELGALTVLPSALEGKLPEPDDFLNAAILAVGLKGATTAAAKIQKIYAKTGVLPEQVLADAKADPKLAEELAKPSPELPTAYKEAAKIQNALDAVPGEKAMAVAAKPFAEIPQAKGEPAQPSHVNYNFINTTEDAKGALARLSEVYKAEIETQRRGTVPWEQTQAEAGKIISDMLGSTEPFKPREPGTPAGAAELLARKQMVVGAAEDMALKAKELADLGTNATAEQTAAFLASIDRAAMIQSEFLGARAEAGRALNILKETKIAAERAQQIQDLIARFGKDPIELAQMLKDMDNPAAALKFAREATKATKWEKVVEAWKAGLVSGPITQIANIMGNATFTAMRPAVDAVAAAIGTVTRGADRVSIAEPLGRIIGNLEGAREGLKMAAVAFKEDGAGPNKAEHFKQAIEGNLGYAIRTPFRALSAGDAFFREMNRRGELYASATNQAAKEGFNPASREFRERIAEIVQNPSQEMLDAADAAATRFTFQAPLGKHGQSIQNFVRTNKLEWAVPFITTPANVFKETARLTPFAPIVGEWRAAFQKGGVERDRAIAELSTGAATMGVVFSLALAGDISGAGDPDPNKRRIQMAAGWQPYSIKIGDTWYNYQRIQPIGTLMGLAADLAEVWEHLLPDERDKTPKMLSVAFANSVTNTTFLKGMTSVIQVMADPTRYGGKFVQDLASSTVPAIVGQTTGMFDPYVREIDSVRDAVMNRIPGLRQELPPARDAFGDAIKNKARVGEILPITTTTESKDKVRSEAARLGVGADKAPKSIQMPSAGDRRLGKVELTPEQRDVFADVGGHFAYQALSGIVNSPYWDTMPDMVKQRAYKIAFEKGNEAGKIAALSDEQRQKEILRITSEIAKRLAQ